MVIDRIFTFCFTAVMLTVKHIRDVVCEYLGVTQKQIEGGSRLSMVAFARQSAIALTCEFFDGRMNQKSIAKEFKCCRSNITHACNRVKALTSYENKYKADYEKMLVLCAVKQVNEVET